ncbi:Ig-like domain-containing protein [Lacinutrix neustonica]|uniref:Ig-like domain-containing protein n=1 Tax=Lacinutrix neustonica TaxID=2980107 RepID=A0A9E8MVP8_9FLAO|nr:Ig-like domain-containing protein [Lacinutrix neustonica]WAC02443.1 Ig-like domain-containing protein [Lacinutrix neustonica]
MITKILKKFQILAMIPLLLVAGCSNDDDGSTPVVSPAVVGTNPDVDGIDVAINTSIEISFNKAMETSTINTSTYTLVTETTNVVGTVTYLNETAIFSPASNLQWNTVYTATITSGAKDISGNPLAANYSFSFTTGIETDIIAPTVVLTDPIDNAIDVARNKAIAITFDENMRAASFTATSFSLVQGTNTISGSIEYANNTARFIPRYYFRCWLKLHCYRY